MLESVQASQVSVACFVALLLVAAASDIVSYRIPNWVVLAILLLYPVYVLVTPADVDWPWALAVFAAAIVVGMGLSAAGIFDAGDAKLMAAVDDAVELIVGADGADVNRPVLGHEDERRRRVSRLGLDGEALPDGPVPVGPRRSIDRRVVDGLEAEHVV